MLTIRQLLILSGQSGGDTLNTNALLAPLRPRPLSLKSVISAFEKQRVLLFVSLVSPRLLQSRRFASISDLLEASKGSEGQINASEILALSTKLREHGLSLRVLDKELRRAAIIGTVPSLFTVLTVPLSDSNLPQIFDVLEPGPGAFVAVGAVEVAGSVLAILFLPELSIGILLVAVTWAALGSIAMGIGLADLLGPSKDAPKPAPQADSTDTNTTPNDIGSDDPAGEPIEIPNAVAFGSPPDDFNLDGVLQDLGDFSVDFTVDMVLSDLPVGFDANTGGGLPGIPGENGGDDGGGGGFNPFG
jgi:hypothetical protein